MLRYKNMPKKSRRANSKNLKKTSRRGAYKPARKKQMMIRRAPMVESKKDERYEWTGKQHIANSGPGLSAYADNLVFADLGIGDNPTGADPAVPQHVKVGIPDTYMYRTQGFGSTHMVGESIFIKYLKMKFEIKLPADAGLIHFPQCQLYLVHGFVDKGIDATATTSPTLTALSRTNIAEFVAHQVEEYFKDSNEPMRYQPKGRNYSSVKILGRKEIKWNKAKSILPDPVRSGTDTHYGELPTKIVDCEWPMMKKVRYERAPAFTSASGAEGASPLPNNYFVNHTDQLPFWALYMPGGNNIVYSQAVNRVQFRANDVCYFTDS